MAINDVYRLKFTLQSDGQIFQNVYYYLGLTNNATAENLAEGWQIQKTAALRDLISVNSNFLTVSAENLSSAEADYVYNYVGISGNRAGENMPTFTAWGFELVVTSATIRNGAKRIGPIAEGDVLNNNASAGMIALLDAWATDIQIPVQFGGVDTFQLGVFRANQLGTSYTPVTDVVYKRVTTQNSRKIY